MKRYLVLLAAVLLGSSTSPSGWSSAWADRVRDGGDMCEDRIALIRDDLKAWLKNGGAQGLRLPAGLDLPSYTEGMLKSIEAAQISCTQDKVLIGQAEKTCVNTALPSGEMRILCNWKRFQETSESDQYVLVHHEFAGLSQFEENTGEASNYSISNQISYFLENQVVKKLVVKPAPQPRSGFLTDKEADERILASCEDYRSRVNLAIVNFLLARGGRLHGHFEIGQCRPMKFYGGQAAIELNLPLQFETSAFSDGSEDTTFVFTAAEPYMTPGINPVRNLSYEFWWTKSPVYNNLGNLDGYEYRFIYRDHSDHDTDGAVGVTRRYYYGIRNKKTGTWVGGVDVNGL